MTTLVQRIVNRNAPMSLRCRDPRDIERLDRTVVELRGRGLSYRSISTVLDLYEAVEVSESDVRSWLSRMGAPTNQNMTRTNRED